MFKRVLLLTAFAIQFFAFAGQSRAIDPNPFPECLPCPHAGR